MHRCSLSLVATQDKRHRLESDALSEIKDVKMLSMSEFSLEKDAIGDRFLSSTGTERNCALPMMLPSPAQYWTKIVDPWVQKLYPALDLGSGERLLGHSQTPVLHWIKISLREKASHPDQKK